jgi:hypothetical protein
MARARNAMVALFPGLFKGRLPHQIRQLGDIRRDPPRLIVSTYASRLNTKGKKTNSSVANR